MAGPWFGGGSNFCRLWLSVGHIRVAMGIYTGNTRGSVDHTERLYVLFYDLLFINWLINILKRWILGV